MEPSRNELRDPLPLVYPGMVQAPGYQPAMIPAPVPMMPAVGTVPTIPGEAGLRAPGEAFRAKGGGEGPAGSPEGTWDQEIQI